MFEKLAGKITFSDPRAQLAILWLLSCAGIFILTIIYTIFSVFSEPVYFSQPCSDVHLFEYLNKNAFDSKGRCSINIPPTYEDKSAVVWDWLAPMTLPTASLIVSSIIFEAQSEKRYEVVSDSKLYFLALALTAFYLLLLFFTVLFSAFPEIFKSNDSAKYLTPTEWLSLSKSWLVPIQGLVVAAMGAYFIDRREVSGEGGASDGNGQQGLR